MAQVKDIEDMPDKLTSRADYLKGEGFVVKLRVSYTRIRRIRALNEDQAAEFAMIREAKYAPKYFHSQTHMDYHVETVEAVDVTKAPTKKEEVIDD